MKKECPICKVKANGIIRVDVIFGLRKVKGKQYGRTYCRKCNRIRQQAKYRRKKMQENPSESITQEELEVEEEKSTESLGIYGDNYDEYAKVEEETIYDDMVEESIKAEKKVPKKSMWDVVADLFKNAQSIPPEAIPTIGKKCREDYMHYKQSDMKIFTMVPDHTSDKMVKLSKSEVKEMMTAMEDKGAYHIGFNIKEV